MTSSTSIVSPSPFLRNSLSNLKRAIVARRSLTVVRTGGPYGGGVSVRMCVRVCARV
jgi:hypothetical protein